MVNQLLLIVLVPLVWLLVFASMRPQVLKFAFESFRFIGHHSRRARGCHAPVKQRKLPEEVRISEPAWLKVFSILSAHDADKEER